MTYKTKETAPPLIKQMREFLRNQFEHSERKGLTVGIFVTSANETSIAGFWREHATGDLRTKKSYEILRFLSPFREEKYMWQIFEAGKTLSETFIQDLFSMSVNLLLVLYLVFPRYLSNMGPAFMSVGAWKLSGSMNI